MTVETKYLEARQEFLDAALRDSAVAEEHIRQVWECEHERTYKTIFESRGVPWSGGGWWSGTVCLRCGVTYVHVEEAAGLVEMWGPRGPGDGQAPYTWEDVVPVGAGMWVVPHPDDRGYLEATSPLLFTDAVVERLVPKPERVLSLVAGSWQPFKEVASERKPPL